MLRIKNVPQLRKHHRLETQDWRGVGFLCGTFFAAFSALFCRLYQLADLVPDVLRRHSLGGVSE